MVAGFLSGRRSAYCDCAIDISGLENWLPAGGFLPIRETQGRQQDQGEQQFFLHELGEPSLSFGSETHECSLLPPVKIKPLAATELRLPR